MTIQLSQRNLLSLLHGLTTDTSTYLIKPGIGAVTAVADKLAYPDRAPGRMSPETEQFIKDAEQWLAGRKQ